MRKLRILVLMLMVMALAAPFSFAAEQTFGDGQIKMEIFEDWQVVEESDAKETLKEIYGCSEEEASNYMEYYYSLVMAKNASLDPKALMQLSYSTDYDEGSGVDFFTCTDEELEVYYKDQGGKEVLENAALFLTFGMTEADDEIDFFETPWATFIHQEKKESLQSGVQLYHNFYFTMRDCAVITFDLTTAGAPTAGAIDDMEKMLSSFSDDGWYDSYTLAANSEPYEDAYGIDGEDASGEILFSVFIVMIIVAGAVVARMSKGRRIHGRTHNRPETMAVERKTAGEAKTDKEQIRIPKAKPIKADGKEIRVKDGEKVRAKSPDESYMDSLHTLLASGLLTKEEYRDMVEAHYRNNRK